MAHIIDDPETGGRVKWHLTAADTGGRLLRAEWWTPAGGGMRGAYVHRSVEERIEVLAGRMTAELDGRLVELGPGEHLAVPARVRQRWWNSGDEELHFVAERGDTADIPNLEPATCSAARTRAGGSRCSSTRSPRSLAAPTHVHEHEDEFSFVLAGRIGAQLGDRLVEAGPGELVRKPRGIPHAFWNPGDEEARVLELISPGGFETYFAELAPLLAVGGAPDVAALDALQARYSLAMDPDSVGPLMARHGLAR